LCTGLREEKVRARVGVCVQRRVSASERMRQKALEIPREMSKSREKCHFTWSVARERGQDGNPRPWVDLVLPNEGWMNTIVYVLFCFSNKSSNLLRALRPTRFWQVVCVVEVRAPDGAPSVCVDRRTTAPIAWVTPSCTRFQTACLLCLKED